MTDFKKDTRTADEQAEARYTIHDMLTEKEVENIRLDRNVYAACITEQVTPRDEFIEELVEALDNAKDELASAHIYVPPFGKKMIVVILKEIELLQTKARDRGYDHE